VDCEKCDMRHCRSCKHVKRCKYCAKACFENCTCGPKPWERPAKKRRTE
jgi:hypothetical protein